MEQERGADGSGTGPLLLSSIRASYMQARPPQQIKELGELFEENVTRGAASTADEATSALSFISSIREHPSSAAPILSEGLSDKANFGSGSNTDTGNSGNKTKDTSAYDGAGAISSLFQLTLGYSSEVEEGAIAEDFLHPPIQYRIAFAKYVIKQLESCKWNVSTRVSQGSHEQDEEDPSERETLLEKWYDCLEMLASRRQLSEQFYRLYEIGNVSHCRERGVLATIREQAVKIFENESSFVAVGTTGLVTWEASIEFHKWLISPDRREESELSVELEETRWVLELGCGCGFLAVALTKCMPFLEQYVATDGSLAALEKAKLNVDANFSISTTQRGAEQGQEEVKVLRRKVRFEKVDWQQEETKESFSQLVDGMTSIYGASRGLLVGADIVFDPELLPDLVELIKHFVEAGAGKALLSCTIRNEATMEELKKQLDSSGLSIQTCGKWRSGVIIDISLPKH